jgi:hypothetical protein
MFRHSIKPTHGPRKLGNCRSGSNTSGDLWRGSLPWDTGAGVWRLRLSEAEAFLLFRAKISGDFYGLAGRNIAEFRS